MAFGAHSGDHAIYPDCRPEFFTLIEASMKAGNEGHIDTGFQLVAPFLNLAKADIVRGGARLGVPFELTWSCYEGGEAHCGACGTCVERREAFAEAGVADPTLYAPAQKDAVR
ncbi:7-cyano-7-deazaguanine synthase [Streptomyces lavendulae]|uniref:7-cyano-7-deazaguanine synthase n=1 Tax=Streptomyces lavendulae TaxID=1914 RepID=UPI0036CE991E